VGVVINILHGSTRQLVAYAFAVVKLNRDGKQFSIKQAQEDVILGASGAESSLGTKFAQGDNLIGSFFSVHSDCL
jgi:hypothetical protein